MNIGVREIEDLLVEHVGVRSAAVVGLPDEQLGERVCCYIQPTDPTAPPSLDGLTSYLHEHGLAIHKAPELELIAELPMTATGKIQKHLLLQHVASKIEGRTGSRRRLTVPVPRASRPDAFPDSNHPVNALSSVKPTSVWQSPAALEVYDGLIGSGVGSGTSTNSSGVPTS